MNLQRPSGQPLMHQAWGKLLFIHWPVDPELLRPLIPETLTIDSFDGSAWIGIVPFTMWDIRPFPPYVPSFPGLSAMHELNVRTYVTCNAFPGVWFFSLDCNSAAAVLGARTVYHLPYFNAEIYLQQTEKCIDYRSIRTDDPPANFNASWTIGDRLAASQTGSLEYFLTERYCLYTKHRDEIYRCRIYHEQWPLHTASLVSMSEMMLAPVGISTPIEKPLVHYAEEISVEIWGLEKVRANVQ